MRTLCSLGYLLLALAALSCAGNDISSPIALAEVEPPDALLFARIEEVAEQYRKELQWADRCSFVADREAGRIASNWHPVHKGEVERKLECYVWGSVWRVDVWDRPAGGLRKAAGKGYMARLAEMQIQQRIVEAIASSVQE